MRAGVHDGSNMVTSRRSVGLWATVALVGAMLLAWIWPRSVPLAPQGLEISREEAKTIAIERLRELGNPVENPYVVIRLRPDVRLERRLQVSTDTVDLAALQQSELQRMVLVWEVRVYESSALPNAWTYLAHLAVDDGEVLALRQQIQGAQGDASVAESAPAASLPDDGILITRARQALADHGMIPGRFEDDATVRRLDSLGSSSAAVRFQSREAILGDRLAYGLSVYFEATAEGLADRGYEFWYNDPDSDTVDQVFRRSQLVGTSRVVLFYILLPFVAVPFLRRYHDGQLGVRRGVQIAIASVVAGLLITTLGAKTFSSGTNIGFLNRQQTTWLVGGFFFVFQLLGLAILGLMSWSVGEFYCRQRWPQKLASLDALFRGRWDNATVARSALRGTAVGVALAGVYFALSCLRQDAGGWAVGSLLFASAGIDMPATALASVGGIVSYYLPLSLFTCLLLPSWATARLGSTGGLILSLAVAVFLAPLIMVQPLEWGWLIYSVVAMAPVLLFRFGDLLSALLATLVSHLLITLMPVLAAADPGVQSQGYLALLLMTLPFLLSVRHVMTDREFIYAWDDVPPHVRRIAERERQRVEIETARNIQSSILPELPPQLNGVEIAHSYMPASEVGGDFYDVLALDDGRLAVAVGDVAGHGVASGLVMSMARSALAVQVTFEPEVQAVLSTLNRMVYQSARRRLLSTLCYAILDPKAHEIYYASAGHVFPYRVSKDGDVEPLRAASYPLGVRRSIEAPTRTSKVERGDSIFFYSDGLVEATAEDDDEPFGFDRLEASLERHAHLPPKALQAAVLEDVWTYTGRAAQDDDLTVLVLRFSEA